MIARTAALTALGLTGCDGRDASAVPSSAAPQADSQTLFVGQCGPASDADVSALSGLTGLRLVSADPLTCRWETPDATRSATFDWFRGSPIDDHHSGDPTAPGPRTTVTIDGRPAYIWRARSACEAAVGTGAGDFITWTVESAAGSAADPCDAATALAATTLTKK